jgi:hypothetical protein
LVKRLSGDLCWTTCGEEDSRGEKKSVPSLLLLLLFDDWFLPAAEELSGVLWLFVFRLDSGTA